MIIFIMKYMINTYILKTNNTVDVTTETIFPFVRMVPSVFTGKYKAEYAVSAGV